MKTGRNDPCPCGSGKKFKKCCLDKKVSARMPPPIPSEVTLHFEKMQAVQEQIQKQQGLGRPIISVIHNGLRFVSSGSKLHYKKAENWQTIHDFLSYYLPSALGKEWGEGESKKSYDQQHPIVQWFFKLASYQKEQRKEGTGVQSAPMIGAASAILNLSYNLFLLEHNVAVQEKLIKRLKNRADFQGALYETYVAAIFIRAGFKIEMEKEDDPDHSHSEFTAIAPSGKKYSVEAKARQPFKDHVGICKQLGKALAKKAEHPRIVFIDVNIPKLMDKVEEIEKELLAKASSEERDWKDAPHAYVFITNNSFVYDLEGTQFERIGFAHGFKIDYFKANTVYINLRDARLTRDKHIDMVNLIKSTREQNEIPVTFDGEIPEFAFNEELKKNRLLIGNKYELPGPDGKKTTGILESAVILENEKRAYGSYLLADGTRATLTCPVTDEEIAAYKRHPDTFFGVPRGQTKHANDPLELYDFFYETAKKTPREKLLEFMKNVRDIDEIKKLGDEELRVLYCEGLVYGAMNAKNTQDK